MKSKHTQGRIQDLECGGGGACVSNHAQSMRENFDHAPFFRMQPAITRLAATQLKKTRLFPSTNKSFSQICSQIFMSDQAFSVKGGAKASYPAKCPLKLICCLSWREGGGCLSIPSTPPPVSAPDTIIVPMHNYMKS